MIGKHLLAAIGTGLSIHVQHMTGGMDGTEVDVSIDPVDLGSSFLILTVATRGDNAGSSRVVAEFLDAETVRLTRNRNNLNETFSLFVVEAGGANVQTVTGTLAANSAEVTESILPVDPASTLVVGSNRGPDETRSLAGALLEYSLPDATTLRVRRSVTDDDFEVDRFVAYVVSF